MAAADDKVIEDGALDFSQRLHAELPLRHFGEFHDLDKLADVVNVQKRNVFAKVFDKVWPREKEEIVSLIKKLNHRMDKEVIADWMKKNQEHEIRCVSFLQKWVDMLCENFNEALEYQILLNPDMEIESLENYISNKRLIVTNVFESIWKPGNSQIQEERKSKLEKHLKAKEEEMLEKQKHNLERKSVTSGKKLLGDVGSVLLERSRQLKSYVDKQKGRTSLNILKGMVEEMLDYLLTGKGSSLRETHKEIYGKLLKSLEGEVKFLIEEPEEKIVAEAVVSYANRFYEKLWSYCFGVEGDTGRAQEIPIREQDPLRQEALQEMLNELEEQRSSGLDDGTHGDANDNHCGLQVHEDEVMHVEDDKKTSAVPKQRISPRHQLTKDGDSIMTYDATSKEVPPSWKAAAVVEKAGGIQYPNSAGQMNSRKSVQPASSGDSRKKMTSANTINGKDINHLISDEDDLQIQNGDVSPETASASPEQSSKRTQDKRKDNVEVEDLPQKTKKPRKDSCKTMKNAEDKCPIRRSARLRNSSETTRALHVNSRKRREPFVEKMKTKKTINDDDDEFELEECDANCDEGELSSPDPVQPSSSKTFGKKLKGSQMVKPACPSKMTLLQGDIPRYQCNVCKAKFRLKDTYLLKYHGDFCEEKNRPHVCSECGKGFFQRQHLTSHSRSHTGEKPLKCPKCPMAFKQSSNLTRHIRIHTGDKPYKCTECPMRFMFLCNLKVHRRAHDGETRFICKACNVKFVSSHALHNHNLTHEGKLPFVCNYCKERFGKMNLLKQHVVVHSGERPFQCPTCAVSATAQYNLVSHLENIHGHPRKVAVKLASDAALEYLLKETGNQSCRDIPQAKINSVVVNHVIKKANLQLPDDITVASAKCKGRKE